MKVALSTLLLSCLAAFGAGNVAGPFSDQHQLWISPTATRAFAIRGDPSQPGGVFWNYDGTNASGVFAQATNGDTINIMPGSYFVTVMPLNPGVTVRGVGNPIIIRTNFFIGGTNLPFQAERPMVYLADNCLIEGLTLQCGTNTYDSVFGPSLNTEDNGPFVVQDLGQTNIYGANVNDLHTLFIWPEYGLTNFQRSCTNTVIRKCTLYGATDVLYQGGDGTCTLIYSNAAYPAGSGFEVGPFVTNNPPIDYLLDNCRVVSQWDWIRTKGSNSVARTRQCLVTLTANCPSNVTASAAFTFFAGGYTINQNSFYYDDGSAIYTSPTTNTTSRTFSIISSARIYLNGTRLFGTNTPNADPLEVTGNWSQQITNGLGTNYTAGSWNNVYRSGYGNVVVTNVVYTNVTLDFPQTSAQSVTDLVISAATTFKSNDVVIVCPPAFAQTNGIFYGWMSNTTPMARYVNIQGTAVNPASGIFNVTIQQFK